MNNLSFEIWNDQVLQDVVVQNQNQSWVSKYLGVNGYGIKNLLQ